jgi:hypothetical protein
MLLGVDPTTSDHGAEPKGLSYSGRLLESFRMRREGWQWSREEILEMSLTVDAPVQAGNRLQSLPIKDRHPMQLWPLR